MARVVILIEDALHPTTKEQMVKTVCEPSFETLAKKINSS